MYACPSCHSQTISGFRKWLSSPATPALCETCHSYSHAHRASGSVGWVVAILVVTVSGFVASALHAQWPLVAGVITALLCYGWHWHRVELEPLSAEEVRRARAAQTAWSLAFVLSWFLN